MNKEHAQRVYFEQIKRAIPLAAVLEHYGVLHSLKRVGRQLHGPCPIHGGTNKRQFSVDLTQGVWKCFSPDHIGPAGGGMLEFVAAMERTDIREAALMVGEWFAIRPAASQVQRVQRRKTVSDTNRPTHRVFAAKKRDGQKDWLTEIGSAWIFSYQDDKKTGVNIQLTALPVGDRIVLFENDAEDPQKADASEKKAPARSKR